MVAGHVCLRKPAPRRVTCPPESLSAGVGGKRPYGAAFLGLPLPAA